MKNCMKYADILFKKLIGDKFRGTETECTLPTENIISKKAVSDILRDRRSVLNYRQIK